MSSDTEVGTDVGGNTSSDLDFLGKDDDGEKKRAWFFTIYEKNWEAWYASLCLEKPFKQYWGYQKEKCPSTGRIHWQAVIYYKHAQGIKGVRKRFFGIYCRPCISIKGAIEYCKKSRTRIEDPVTWGEVPEQGRRTDLETVALEIVEGKSERDIATENPGLFIRYFKGMQRLREVCVYKDRTEPPEVIWIWGLAGTNKTRTARERDPDFYIKDGTMWWDGYTQQKVIIIDDFDGKWPYRDLLRLLDRYPYQGQVKGGYVKINSPIIYITCEFAPSKFWEGNEYAQIARRLSSIVSTNKQTEIIDASGLGFQQSFTLL